jgi:hypothetical protein
MKYYSTKFEEYVKKNEKRDLHSKTNKKIKKELLSNVIIYGPQGIGKYTQSLKIISNYSDSKLKYERKLNFTYNKKDYVFKVSDAHIELDMQLLGCNAKLLFNELYYHFLNVFSLNNRKIGFILCKNFQHIHTDLLTNFYSYMQTTQDDNIKLYFIIVTNSISFIPNNILKKCNVINYPRPTKTEYNKITKKKLEKGDINKIDNIKDVLSNNKIIEKDKIICNKIINSIKNYKTLEYSIIRELLYDLFIYNYDVINCLYYIVKVLINDDVINDDNIFDIFLELNKIMKKYNNNYRPIFHLEKFVYYIIIKTNGL